MRIHGTGDPWYKITTLMATNLWSSPSLLKTVRRPEGTSLSLIGTRMTLYELNPHCVVVISIARAGLVSHWDEQSDAVLTQIWNNVSDQSCIQSAHKTYMHSSVEANLWAVLHHIRCTGFGRFLSASFSCSGCILTSSIAAGTTCKELLPITISPLYPEGLPWGQHTPWLII